jgi:hypothetical protein
VRVLAALLLLFAVVGLRRWVKITLRDRPQRGRGGEFTGEETLG